jgi:HPt (histidine-containing phosphotransfer) domain-containing protein
MRFDTFDADQVLREYGDAATLAELVAIVRTDVAECACSIEQAAGAGDLNRVRDAAHAVKGVADAVAARFVSELAGRVDTGLRRGDKAVAESAPALVVECRRLVADLETWLGALDAPTAH